MTTVSNELIMECLRSDLFPLWTAGKLFSAEAIPHAQYVGGGILVSLSGHGKQVMRGTAPALSLGQAIASDMELSKLVQEFVQQEGGPQAKSFAFEPDNSESTAAWMAVLLKILLDVIVKFMKERM